MNAISATDTGLPAGNRKSVIDDLQDSIHRLSISADVIESIVDADGTVPLSVSGQLYMIAASIRHFANLAEEKSIALDHETRGIAA